jgi:hypothetical protein
METSTGVTCTVCGKCYDNAAALSMHVIRSHRTTVEKLETCGIGEKGKKGSICSVCNRCFANDRALRGHVQAEHSSTIHVQDVTRGQDVQAIAPSARTKEQCNDCGGWFVCLANHRVCRARSSYARNCISPRKACSREDDSGGVMDDRVQVELEDGAVGGDERDAVESVVDGDAGDDGTVADAPESSQQEKLRRPVTRLQQEPQSGTTRKVRTHFCDDCFFVEQKFLSLIKFANTRRTI